MMMNGNSYHHHDHHSVSDNLLDGFTNGSLSRSSSDGYATIPASSSSFLNSSPSPSSYSSSASACGGNNYIEHRVSKMDTLAGVAIKYGVEVADIRRMNGLVTDLQMFALDILRIPLPGRHPPSPIVPNGSATNGEHTPPHRPHDDVLDSLQSLKLKPPRRVSPAMSSLRGYYGLTPPKKGPTVEAEMAVYRTGRTLDLDDESYSKSTPASDLGLNRQRKSRSMSMLSFENGAIENEEVAGLGDSSEADRFVRRRQKADTDPSQQMPEILLKEDNSGGFLGRIGRGLALRPKIGSRTDLDAGWQNSIAATAGDFFNDVFVSMRKSSSTSSLQESENSSFIWATSKWSLKTEALARPIFDGLPKSATGRRNKTALD